MPRVSSPLWRSPVHYVYIMYVLICACASIYCTHIRIRIIYISIVHYMCLCMCQFVSAIGVVCVCHTQAHIAVCLFVSTSSVALVLRCLTVHLLTLIVWQMMSLFSLHQWNSWEAIPPLEGRRSPKMVVHGPNINFGNQIWNTELASRLCAQLCPFWVFCSQSLVQCWTQVYSTDYSASQLHTDTHTHTLL